MEARGKVLGLMPSSIRTGDRLMFFGTQVQYSCIVSYLGKVKHKWIAVINGIEQPYPELYCIRHCNKFRCSRMQFTVSLFGG